MGTQTTTKILNEIPTDQLTIVEYEATFYPDGDEEKEYKVVVAKLEAFDGMPTQDELKLQADAWWTNEVQNATLAVPSQPPFQVACINVNLVEYDDVSVQKTNLLNI
jgi:hypothetical protein